MGKRKMDSFKVEGDCRIVLLNGDGSETEIGRIPRESVEEVLGDLANITKLRMVCAWCNKYTEKYGREATHWSKLKNGQPTMAWMTHRKFATAIIIGSKEKLKECLEVGSFRQYVDIELVDRILDGERQANVESEEQNENKEQHDEHNEQITTEGKIEDVSFELEDAVLEF